MITVKEIQQRKKAKLQQQQKIYSYIMNKLNSRISQYSEHQTFCIYRLPAVVFGKPFYNIVGCMSYLKKKLIENGFDLIQSDERTFVVFWNNSEEKQVDVEKKQKIAKSLLPPKQQFKSYDEILLQFNNSNKQLKI